VSGEPAAGGEAGEQHELLARLRAVIEAKDAENAALRAELARVRGELGAERELRRRLELRVAELERRLGMDSSNSGTPTSKEPVGAKERRKAERRNRQASERERRKDRRRGGQPGHPGTGLSRDPPPAARTGRAGNRSACPTGSQSARPRWRKAPTAGWNCSPPILALSHFRW
jgi:transposase